MQENKDKESYKKKLQRWIDVIRAKTNPGEVILESDNRYQPPQSLTTFQLISSKPYIWFKEDFEYEPGLEEVTVGPTKESIRLESKAKRFIISMLNHLVEMGYLFFTKNDMSLEYSTTFKLYLDTEGEDTIFIARAFNHPQTKKVCDKIKEDIKAMNLNPIMLEDDPQAGNINLHIKNSIMRAKLVLVDITPRQEEAREKTARHNKVTVYNPNVFFEAGLADGLGKKVLYIRNNAVTPTSKNSENLPFDISAHTTLTYNTNNDQKLEEFYESIKKVIKTHFTN